jgi:hypothetical protein
MWVNCKNEKKWILLFSTRRYFGKIDGRDLRSAVLNMARAAVFLAPK